MRLLHQVLREDLRLVRRPMGQGLGRDRRRGLAGLPGFGLGREDDLGVEQFAERLVGGRTMLARPGVPALCREAKRWKTPALSLVLPLNVGLGSLTQDFPEGSPVPGRPVCRAPDQRWGKRPVMPRPGWSALVIVFMLNMGSSTDIDVTFAGDDLVLRLVCAAYLAATPAAPASTALQTCACTSDGVSTLS